MILKGERVVQEPSLQINLHKVLNLSTGSSVATLEGRNFETPTCTSRNSGKKQRTRSWHFCSYIWSASYSKVDEGLICANGKLLSMKALTNPRCRPQFGCSMDRNKTTAAYTHYQTEGIADIKGNWKNEKSKNYRSFHHRYDANTEHNKDPEAKLTCIDNDDWRSIGNNQKKRQMVRTCRFVRTYIEHQCSCNLWYSMAVWPSTSSTKLPWRKLQSHL
jgi:hypothetical protein